MKVHEMIKLLSLIPNQEAENYACLMATTINRKSFPGGSVSKESTCNAGYPGSIPE